MTDLRHIAQLLHEAGVSEGLGPDRHGHLARAAHPRAGAATPSNEERARRLESDAEAVQVITIHRSKGLEFPIVYCPYLWDGRTSTIGRARLPRPDNGQPAHHRRRRTRATSFAAHQKLELEEGGARTCACSTSP